MVDANAYDNSFLCITNFESSSIFMQKRKRLNTIMVLMLVSIVMLAGFTARWLYFQYKEEKSALVNELSGTYYTTKEKYLDALFKQKYYASDSVNSKASFVVMSTDQQDTQRINHIIQSPVKTGATFHTTEVYYSDSTIGKQEEAVIQKKLQPSVVNYDDEVNVHQTIGDHGIIAGTSVFDTSEIEAGIKNLITTITNGQFALKIDTVAFKKSMDSVMAKTFAGIHYRFAPNMAGELSVKGLSDNNRPFFSISNYQWFLVKKMSPQIAFCFVLLLLCGLAFTLSYFTLRQQMRLSEQKNDFISNMSHELKTPVTTAQLALEAFNHYDVLADAQKTKDYLQIAAWEMKRLEMLVGNMFNNARLEEGRILFQKEPIAVAELLHRLVLQFAPVCEEQSKELAFEYEGAELFVVADKLHLMGALYNIIDNAIKYGKHKTSIVLNASTSTVQIAITDDGPGIPVAYKDKIFEKFFRVPTGNLHLVKGYGLGLHYTKYVIAENGGTIKVQSAETGGTTFLITLPKQSGL